MNLLLFCEISLERTRRSYRKDTLVLMIYGLNGRDIAMALVGMMAFCCI